MTLALVKPGGWDENDIVTSDELNELQERITRALDGQDGGTYELDDDLVFDGTGAVVIANEVTIQPGATLDMDGTLELGGTTDLTGQLDVASGGDINVESGGEINVKTGGRIDVESAGLLVIASSGQVHVSGDLDIETGGDLTVKNGGDLIIATGGVVNVTGDLNIQSGGDQTIQSGGKLTVASGGIVELAEGDWLTINAAPFTARMCMTPISTPAGWAFGTGGSTFGWDMTGAAGEKILFGLPLNPGDTLLTASIRLEGDGAGGGSHASIVGMDMPQIEVIRKNNSTGVFTIIGTGVDSSANGAAYDAAHDIVCSLGPGHTITTDTYYLRITAEGGPNADAGATRVYSMQYTGLARNFRGSNEAHV